MPLENTTILISGGGVAGPALAYWLKRYGFTPIIVERAAETRTGGQRIAMMGDGVRALRRLGVLERAQEAGGRAPGGTVAYGAGTRPIRLPELTADESPERAGLAIQRGRLGRILYEHVRDDVEYVFDDSITGIKQANDGVKVTFERSAPRRVDLVVGADGLHSNVRSLVFGARERFTRFLGTNLVIFTVDNGLDLRDDMRFHIMRYRGCAITTFPGNTDLEGMFLVRSARPLEVRDLTTDQKQQFVERIFAADARRNPEVAWLLRVMRDSRDFHFAPSTQVTMPTWTSGRVSLLGDAAYCPDPMSGQGTSLAVVGAHILAGELKAARGDHTIALPAFEAAMRETVAANQRLAKFSTSFAAPRTGPAGLWTRERVTRGMVTAMSLGERIGLDLSSWGGADSDVTLRDYGRKAGTVGTVGTVGTD